MMPGMFRAFVTSFAFLTRLPVRLGTVSDQELGRSVAFFPFVGLTLGFVLTGLGYGLTGMVPTTLAAVLVVALLAAMTGGLHLDGVADLFDGLGGGRGDRDRTLSIMRDSRIGAHGAVALVLVLAAKIAAVATLLDGRDFLSVIAFPVIARWAVTVQIVLFRYVRPDGLGRAFSGQARARELVVATVTMAVVACVLGPAIIKEAGAGLATSLLIALWMTARIGGLTGDIYGATIEITETLVLFVAAAR
jgi:adenosylcobinamide-GDP ribazoletransferase